jgi:hypothetical protein
MAATILTIADLAARLETDARTTRKFLRTITPADEQPGKGARWAIEARKVQSLQAKFRKFNADAEAAAKARTEVVLDPLFATDDSTTDFQEAMKQGDTVIATTERHDLTIDA